MQSNEFQPDSIVQSIIDKFTRRAKMGKEKYGTDMDRNDLTLLEWVEHAKEEAMDLVVYLTKIEEELKAKNKL